MFCIDLYIMPITNLPVPNRKGFMEMLEQNKSVLIFKFGAEWCAPCQKIKNDVHILMANMPEEITCFDVDIDDSFDLYAYLKSKKIVNGVPCLLAYFAGNTTFAPDEVVLGSRMTEINYLFEISLAKYQELQNSLS